MSSLLILLASVALAQDDDLGDLPEPETTVPTEVPVGPTGEGPIDPDEDFDPDEEAGTGADAATEAFRALSTRLVEAEAEERLAAWEAYLQQYPESAQREQVEKEIRAAEAELYGEGIKTETEGISNKRQIAFPEGILLENLNPATRIRLGFDWGLPEWINLIGDVEYAVNPRFSAHVGTRKRFTGWSLEAGGRVAPVKLVDEGLIGSVAFDAHLGVDPAMFGLRPTALLGWRPIDDLYLQAQAGPDFESISGDWGTRWRVGGNATWRAAKPVAIYVEWLTEMKYVNWPGGAFQFHTGVFGMRFYPVTNSRRIDPADIPIGAGVPVLRNYWDFHKGAATIQGLAYLE